MILILDVYNLLLDSLRADKRGLSCEVDEFNRLIRLVSQEVKGDYLKTFEEDIDSSDSLAGLKVHNYAIDLVPQTSSGTAYGTMPTNYSQIMGKPRTLNGSTYVRADIVTEFEDGDRESDFLTKATTTHPTCRIGGLNGAGLLQIKVRPQTINKIWISYIRAISTPFLDYYVNNTTYVRTFLSATTTPQSIPSGSTYSLGTLGGASVTVTSRTVNLEWDEDTLELILAKLVQKVAAQLPDPGLLQTGMADELKTQA